MTVVHHEQNLMAYDLRIFINPESHTQAMLLVFYETEVATAKTQGPGHYLQFGSHFFP